MRLQTTPQLRCILFYLFKVLKQSDRLGNKAHARLDYHMIVVPPNV